MEQIMALVNYFIIIITKSDVSQNVNFKSKQMIKEIKETKKK